MRRRDNQTGDSSMTVAVVTGATRGVGKGVAIALGETGTTVYCTGRSARETMTFPGLGGTVEETAAAVTKAGGEGVGVVCNHTDDAAVRAVFDRAEAERGRLDILVNSVWGGYESYHRGEPEEMARPFNEQPFDLWDKMFAAGVRAHHVAAALAVPLMASGELIVTISFFGGSYFSAGDPVAYGVAKAADDRLAVAMASQLRERGITSVSLYPGLASTESVLQPAEFLDLTGSESPLFTGPAVVALATDPDVLSLSDQVLVVAELATRYGFTDLDGSVPPSLRARFTKDA